MAICAGSTMSDQTLQRELRRLLSDVDLAREGERLAERDRAIAERTLLAKHGGLLEQVVVPSLRLIMLELERRGHLAKLERRGERGARLEVQVAGRKAIQATLEAELLLDGAPRLRLSVVHQFRVLQTLEADLEGLSEKTLAPLLLRSMQRVTSLAT
jgi:hypothetical protein